tara:strand:- start:29 stop:163 length:135 start_codon:yes stop_codon:yes gene_type:complete
MGKTTDFGFGVKVKRVKRKSKIAGGKVTRFKIINTKIKKKKKKK